MKRPDLAAIRGYTRMTLWIWPTVAVVVALMVGTALSRLDVAVAEVFFRGDADAGRQVLTALVGGLVTALSVVFSITIIGLQLVHSEYSPRLLRNFIQDSAAQITLATFAGTAAYILAVLRTIPAANGDIPVPRLAIVVGMFLFLLCVGAVAYYAQHITHSMRVSSAMHRVVDDAMPASVHDGDPSDVVNIEALPVPPQDSDVVPAHESGYLQAADLDDLADFATANGVTIRLRPLTGDSVLQGTPLAWIWPAGRIDADQLLERLTKAVTLDDDRSLRHDSTYGLRQLVDVALRAISPAHNDPYTAVEAIDFATVLLCRMANGPIGSHVRRADDGRVVVAQPGPDLTDCLDLVCIPIRRYGAQDPSVAVRLIRLLRDVGIRASADALPRIRASVESVVEHAEQAMDSPDDLRAVQASAHNALAWLDGNWVVEDVIAARL